MTIDSSPDPEGPGNLPVRRRARRSGRHRGAESFALPPDAPALVLAVPGPEGGPGAAVAAELGLLTETAHTGRPVWIGHLEGDRNPLTDVLAAAVADHAVAEGSPAAVVVPLLVGPHPAVDKTLQDSVGTAPGPVVVAQSLGPHPLIAQALHERLAEAGLARADRVRMVSMVSAAGGIVVATAGGEGAVRDAEMSSVLLASRLAVPVVTGSLDGVPTIRDAAAQLQRTGALRIAIAPAVIGPEVDAGLAGAAVAELGVQSAGLLGAHPALAQLIALRYVEALERALTG
ncbi:sirohydrochlorin chelatase [Actinomadura craniellae]|uniref:sirohydrochlorin chelatase n=1 Tax=Actinomadura craniellae TaxID=2231787 RepID=UPI001F2BA8EC|nr:hypothetical protein [Actinomadura craniellae]